MNSSKSNGTSKPRIKPELPKLNSRAVMIGSELLHLPTNMKFIIDGFAEDLADNSIIVLLRQQGIKFDQIYACPAIYLSDADWANLGF